MSAAASVCNHTCKTAISNLFILNEVVFLFAILFCMGKTHKEQLEIKQELEEAQKKVEVGALYTHYKGADKIYKVIGLGFMEANNELCVIYQAQYDKRLTFIRPLTVWLEQVEWEGKTVPRFSKD